MEGKARQANHWPVILLFNDQVSNCTTDEDQRKLKYVLWFSVIRAENPISRKVEDGPADNRLAQGRFKTQAHQHN